ncbi:TetR/AcrR family transcriptional regulator [Mesorhizobium waimense]|uniref:TetR/AcrR family transcriptional regulator n=1 Tax=Mesorhizobium waimense TaxID=1300307 RepID=A0A3A5KTQ9_9HYPH|nr:TetR/AcrR family transcriptional regulator [Mesorhizobium waimense]RJT38582.1 TetR/AcrR family transcriptional regulator [Mesorhizobium waimense]
MRADNRAERQAEIEKAAYELLQTKGYRGTSMLSIAKLAKASNETLYRWYGDKNGLFKTMVESNARTTKEALATAIMDGTDPIAALRHVAPILLSMLLGQEAIALNRAAAADESGELGRAIAAGGRDSVFPLIETLMLRGVESRSLAAPSASAAADWFLSLLIGDLQIRRVNRTLPLLSDADVVARASTAVGAFRKLCAG